MLPSPTGFHQRRIKSRLQNKPLGIFLRRILKYAQMDFELALWQIFYLCMAPKRVYRNIYYLKQTKNRWSRDDPAVVVLLSLLLIISAIVYGAVYLRSFTGILLLLLRFLFLDFIGVGLVITTTTWLIANQFLKIQSIHNVDQNVEWLYSFDVHCNAFFPMAILLYAIQFVFLPVILRDNIISMFIGNTFYLMVFCYYWYLIFLGYNALPFLQNTIVFLAYPCILLLGTYIISMFGFHIPRILFQHYFYPL